LFRTTRLGRVLPMAQTPVRPRKKRNRKTERKYADRPRIDSITTFDTLTLGELMRLRYGDEPSKTKKNKK